MRANSLSKKQFYCGSFTFQKAKKSAGSLPMRPRVADQWQYVNSRIVFHRIK